MKKPRITNEVSLSAKKKQRLEQKRFDALLNAFCCGNKLLKEYDSILGKNGFKAANNYIENLSDEDLKIFFISSRAQNGLYGFTDIIRYLNDECVNRLCKVFGV